MSQLEVILATNQIPEEPVIGSGSYSSVVRMGNVAVKVGNLTERVPDDFVREIGLLLRIRHPFIINIRRVIIEPDRQKIGMVIPQYFGDLYDVLGKLTEKQIQMVMFRMLQALEFLHENQVVHRDISAKNILMNRDRSSSVLADFGLATLTDYLQTGSSSFGYSFSNRPPEVVMLEGISRNSDIWALGIVFAEMLLGEPLNPPSHLVNDADSSVLEKMYWQFCQTGTPAVRYLNRLDPEYRDLKVIPMGKIFVDLRDKPGVTTDALDLLRKMLHFSRASRMSAKECLEHPYFKGLARDTSPKTFNLTSREINNKPSIERSLVVDWMFSYPDDLPRISNNYIRMETVYLAVSILDSYLSGISGPLVSIEAGAAALVLASCITEPSGLRIFADDANEMTSHFEGMDIDLREVASLTTLILQEVAFDVIAETPNSLRIQSLGDYSLVEMRKIQNVLVMLLIVQPMRDSMKQLENAAFFALEDSGLLIKSIEKYLNDDWAVSLRLAYEDFKNVDSIPQFLRVDQSISPHSSPVRSPVRMIPSVRPKGSGTATKEIEEIPSVTTSVRSDSKRSKEEPSPKPVAQLSPKREPSPTRSTPQPSPKRSERSESKSERSESKEPSPRREPSPKKEPSPKANEPKLRESEKSEREPSPKKEPSPRRESEQNDLAEGKGVPNTVRGEVSTRREPSPKREPTSISREIEPLESLQRQEEKAPAIEEKSKNREIEPLESTKVEVKPTQKRLSKGEDTVVRRTRRGRGGDSEKEK